MKEMGAPHAAMQKCWGGHVTTRNLTGLHQLTGLHRYTCTAAYMLLTATIKHAECCMLLTPPIMHAAHCTSQLPHLWGTAPLNHLCCHTQQEPHSQQL